LLSSPAVRLRAFEPVAAASEFGYRETILDAQLADATSPLLNAAHCSYLVPLNFLAAMLDEVGKDL
jgi:hypothetical protein